MWLLPSLEPHYRVDIQLADVHMHGLRYNYSCKIMSMQSCHILHRGKTAYMKVYFCLLEWQVNGNRYLVLLVIDSK